jgi:hypothetical protein
MIDVLRAGWITCGDAEVSRHRAVMFAGRRYQRRRAKNHGNRSLARRPVGIRLRGEYRRRHRQAGTTHTLVDLAVNVPRPENSKVIWAPDSKRFAVTYSPPHVSHTTFETTAVYQLRNDKWEPLEPLVDEESSMPQVTQLAKDRSPKSRSERRMWKSSPIRDTFKAREWLDANTLVIRAYAEWDRASAPSHAAFLFTFKFDAEGKWKLVKSEDITHKVEDAE